MSNLKAVNWSEFWILVIGSIGFIGAFLLAIPIMALWNSWWAARIWTGYVVPITHWTVIPQATFFVLLLIFGLFRGPLLEQRDHEYKHGSWFIAYFCTGPLINAFCWLVFRWWF